ncbi:MAG TPA: deoxyguanosinetriphosphate triphosphohydrolase [Clostridiales bacterium]|nr:deoxyguanosinetriphosphate triphosphohydrolase [Clostridiales bacterium]
MKQKYLEYEKTFLSPYAQKSYESKGRLIKIAECPMRTEFQRDRDRIIHSKAFRRLKHKTQVFISPSSDHFRTRLTHTLEVTQIARTISRCLSLNEDLTEAIALGHDLGHTPFGHIGERVLDDITKHFRHNEQSLRVVELLEDDGRGLNLTWEVRDGIARHSGPELPRTLEGMVVRISDRIAYLNHDVDDAIAAGLIKESDISQDIEEVLGKGKGVKINTIVKDIIKNSLGKNEIIMSEVCSEAMQKLRMFMFDRVYGAQSAKIEEQRAERLIRSLFNFYKENDLEVPSVYKKNSNDPQIYITDYIAQMSDNYAIRMFEKYFIPQKWDQGIDNI